MTELTQSADCWGEAARTLSAEELRLWDHVQSPESDRSRMTNQVLCTKRHLLEDDLVAAIGTLRESTAAIKTQIKSLQRHREYQLLDPFKLQPRKCERATQDPVNLLGRKDALELQHLRFAIEEEIAAFNSSFDLALRDVSNIRKTTERQLGLRLRNDNQKLRVLQLALPRGLVADSEDDSERRASQLVKKLVEFTCEGTQCRLDRIYLEQLHRPPRRKAGTERGPSDQELSLKNDLDSLYAEIREVVVMSDIQKFEYPLLKLQQEHEQRQSTSESRANQRVLHALSILTESLEEGIDSLESFNSYCASLDALYAIYQSAGATAELATGQDSLITSDAQEQPIKEAAWRALLLHIGMSNDAFVDRRSLEQGLSKKMMKLHAASLLGASSADETWRSVLEINNASLQLLSGTSTARVETTNVAKSESELLTLNDRIGFLKERTEDVELSKPRNSGQEHFLDRWG